jgi:hypothetical protein
MMESGSAKIQIVNQQPYAPKEVQCKRYNNPRRIETLRRAKIELKHLLLWGVDWNYIPDDQLMIALRHARAKMKVFAQSLSYRLEQYKEKKYPFASKIQHFCPKCYGQLADNRFKKNWRDEIECPVCKTAFTIEWDGDMDDPGVILQERAA